MILTSFWGLYPVPLCSCYNPASSHTIPQSPYDSFYRLWIATKKGSTKISINRFLVNGSMKIVFTRQDELLLQHVRLHYSYWCPLTYMIHPLYVVVMRILMITWICPRYVARDICFSGLDEFFLWGTLSVERHKGLTFSLLYTQLDPFASKLTAYLCIKNLFIIHLLYYSKLVKEMKEM